ncbi:hypothetical protein ACKWTF_001055 [Chironomus riparius]
MKVLILSFFLLFCIAKCDDSLPCRFNDGSFGKCVEIKNCRSLFRLYRLGTIRVKDLPICDPVKRLVCCPRISSKKCKEYGQSALKTINSSNTLIKTQCKFSQTSILIGDESEQLTNRFYNEWARNRPILSHNRNPLTLRQFEFPHQAILGYQINDEVKWICSGSLISLNFVLTAARCISSIEYGAVKFVKLGVFDLLNHADKSVTFTVKQTFKHSKDRMSALQNDIALLKLQGSVKGNDNIWPVCLPTRPYYDTKAIKTGFGETGSGGSSQNLLKDIVTKFDQEFCKESYEDHFNETTMLCYGHQSGVRNVCVTDVGGPLQVSNDDQVNCTFTQIGISSIGAGNCGAIGATEGFVNVYKFLDWIERIVWKDEV